MSDNQQSRNSDNVLAAYNAMVDYHNNLVQTRFTVAGLFLAANGFLIGAFFQSSLSSLFRLSLTLLAIVVTIICWLLEVRTYQLLENLGARGLDLEKSFGLNNDQGFFALMKCQPISARLLLTRLEVPCKKFYQLLFSHSLGIGLLYMVIGLFWLFMFIYVFLSHIVPGFFWFFMHNYAAW